MSTLIASSAIRGAVRGVHYSASKGGVVSRVFVDEGQEVSAGQLLASLDYIWDKAEAFLLTSRCRRTSQESPPS